jgi:hypothetical protein
MFKNGKAANNGTGQKLIRLIWDTFLKLWKQRNKQVFGETAKLLRKPKEAHGLPRSKDALKWKQC